MAIDLMPLVPEFREKLIRLLAQCKQAGCEMRAYTALRTPIEQARLWRQSRSKEEIEAAISKLQAAGAPYLAEVLVRAGPQHGDPVTNALPGLSWHQWGEAADCFWLVNGQAEWSTKKLVNGRNGYQVYADLALQLGLTAGGYFKSIKDWPHVQLRAASSPLKSTPPMGAAQIDAAMRTRFGPL